MEKLLRYVSLLIVVLFLFCRETNVLGFSKGVNPLFVSKPPLSSKECKDCHTEIYDEWNNSRHREAYTNSLFKNSHKVEPLTWCVNCHAPLLQKGENPNHWDKRIFPEEGVSCNVCHVRDNKILTSQIPPKAKEHQYIEIKELKTSEFCAECHQFPFPSATNSDSNKFTFSKLQMQNTYSEWKESYFNNKESCQDCHLPKIKNYRSHTFLGGHSKELLEKTFSLKLEKIDTKNIKLILIAKNLGHSFPTGDLFRTLEIELLDKDNKIIYKTNLRYEYEEEKIKITDPDKSHKILKRKDTITPPLKDRDSVYYKFITLSEIEQNNIHFYSLTLNYTDKKEINLFDHYEEKLLFKKESVKIKKNQ